MAQLPSMNVAEIEVINRIAHNDVDGPVLMLNLNKYRDEADFPEGQLYRE